MHHTGSSGKTKTSKKTLSKLRAAGVDGLPDPESYEALLAKYKPICTGLIAKYEFDLGNRLFSRFQMYLKYVIRHIIGSSFI